MLCGSALISGSLTGLLSVNNVSVCLFTNLLISHFRRTPAIERSDLALTQAESTLTFLCKSSWFELGPHALLVQHQEMVCKPQLAAHNTSVPQCPQIQTSHPAMKSLPATYMQH